MIVKIFMLNLNVQLRKSRAASSSVQLLFVIALVLIGACSNNQALPTLTPVPTSTSTPVPTLQDVIIETDTPLPPEATEEPPIEIEFDLLAGEGLPPPFEIGLPEGWQHAYDMLAIPDVDGSLRAVHLTVYRGPVSGGDGTIIVLWGFPNLIGGSPFVLAGTPTPAPNLWTDGLRLFRIALVDRGCNSGTDLQRTYSVGERTGSGTQFAIVDCPASEDTRGWFVGLQEAGLNFVFYLYAEPIAAMDTAEAELQAILDTVRFQVDAAYLEQFSTE